ncbi:Hypothetical predicted protein [Pelobates cultripes]|uniref:Uncharacterized protein n=1 Tax=Pelobates cultripes TaxID=61616 RepID=A0AAD1THB4_PELCU|nr:Hypothetical predicted protein [Pelobates cultripes]
MSNEMNGTKRVNDHTPSPQPTCTRLKIYKLGDLLEKEAQIWWDITSFEFYVANNLVPRGLRLQKPLAYKKKDVNILKKWDQLLDKGSLLLIIFLIGEKKKELEQLEIEIEQLKTDLSPETENGLYAELLDKIERKVKDLDNKIGEGKRRKIMRDKEDYDKGVQRNWKKQNYTKSEWATHQQWEKNRTPNRREHFWKNQVRGMEKKRYNPVRDVQESAHYYYNHHHSSSNSRNHLRNQGRTMERRGLESQRDTYERQKYKYNPRQSPQKGGVYSENNHIRNEKRRSDILQNDERLCKD